MGVLVDTGIGLGEGISAGRRLAVAVRDWNDMAGISLA
jgi:hypothetical protein